jgi:3-hydroxy-9,10-secoandrosta-1,3,5(10)-triene-9,17-dione monooxygenase
VFVPSRRVWYPGKPPEGALLDAPVFRISRLGGPFALPAVLLGIAVGGLEQFVALSKARVSRDGVQVAHSPLLQVRIGESAAEIDAALALLRLKLAELMAQLARTPLVSARLSVLPPGGSVAGTDRLAYAFAAKSAYSALDRLVQAAGASQMMLSQPFQRAFRDVLTGLQQPSNNWDEGRAAGGQALLGG